MSNRCRPRRSERRAVPAAAHRAAAEWSCGWAHKALVASIAVCFATVALAVILVASTALPGFTWGIALPSRTGNGHLELEIARGDVVLLGICLMAVPVVFAVFGLAQTRARGRAARQDKPETLSGWSGGAVWASLALAPNVIGSLWLSVARAEVPALRLIPQLWPVVATVIAAIIWGAATKRAMAIRSGLVR